MGSLKDIKYSVKFVETGVIFATSEGRTFALQNKSTFY